MRAEDKQLLWRFSATTLGMALPLVLIGRSVMFVLIGVGILTGLAATKGESIRVTGRLLSDSWLVLLVIALLAVTLLGASLGINVTEAFHKWLDVVLVVLGGGLLFFTLREMPGQHLEVLMKSLAVTSFAMMALATGDALINDPRLSAALHGARLADNPYRLNTFSSALAVLLPYLWARLLIKSREGEPFARRIALPATLFSIFTLILCGGRAGWVGALAGGVVFVWLTAYWHRVVMHGKQWLAGVATVAVGLAAYGLANGFDFMLQRVNFMTDTPGGRGPLSGRLDVWAAAIRHLGDDIWLGIGLQNYRYLPDAVDIHPHNWLLQMVLETGLVGTLLFGVILALVAWRFWGFAKNNLYGVAACSSLVAFLTTGLANTSIVNVWWLSFLMFTAVLGWRVAWGGPDVASRRRKRLVPRRALVAAVGGRRK
jgi:O-antigen ligase